MTCPRARRCSANRICAPTGELDPDKIAKVLCDVLERRPREVSERESGGERAAVHGSSSRGLLFRLPA